MLRGFARNLKRMEVLDEGQVDAIWRAIFDVLEHTGLKIENEEACKIFERAGCRVDHASGRVRFPPGIVKESLSTCPSSFRVEARDHRQDIVIGGKSVYFEPGPGMQYVDLDTWTPRNATRKEFYDAVTIYDALPNLHMQHNNGPNFSFEGVHPLMGTIESYAARARNSTKSNRMVSSFESEIFNIEIARAVGARGFYACGAASPLAWASDSVKGIMRALDAGIPMRFSSGGIWGATLPATAAGEVVASSAETLGPLVLTQILKPGHPVLPGSFTFPQDMKTGGAAFGNIGICLGSAAFNQVWRRYGVPTYNVEAAIPNSKCIDYQNGYEKSMNALVQALSGASVVYIHGTVHAQLTAHPVQAILDDDVAGMVGRVLEGVQVDDDTLALEVIHEVGPVPGYFLDKEHTRKWWRKDRYMPKAADTSILAEWQQSGRKTCIDLAKERMEQILSTHRISVPLTAYEESAIEKILEEARKYYSQKSGTRM